MWQAIAKLFARPKPDLIAQLSQSPTMEDYQRETARLHNDNVLDVLREGHATTSDYMNCIPGTYAGAVMECYKRGWVRVAARDRETTRYLVTDEGRAALMVGTVGPTVLGR